MEKRNQLLKLICGIVVLLLLTAWIGGVFSGDFMMYHIKNRDELGPYTRDDITYIDVDAPEATSNDGTVNAMDWQETYPYIVATMGQNIENSYVLPRITAVQGDMSIRLKMLQRPKDLMQKQTV